jgi:hypothetical protein
MNSDPKPNDANPVATTSRRSIPLAAALVSLGLGVFVMAGLLQWLRADTPQVKPAAAPAPDWLQGSEEDNDRRDAPDEGSHR